MIRLVTFDLDNTLWEIDPVIVRANQALHQWIEQNVPAAVAYLELQPFKSLRQRIVEQEPQLAYKPTFLRRKMLYQMFREAALAHDQAEQMSEQAFEVFYHHRNHVTLFEEAEALLRQLSQRYTLVALTNGNADLKRIGIDRYFRAHFNADRLPRPKPYPDMFEAALEFAGVAPHEAVHIGDHPDEDVAAAAALGFHTIWFNPPHHAERPDFQPRYQTRRLKDIPALLEQIERQS